MDMMQPWISRGSSGPPGYGFQKVMVKNIKQLENVGLEK